MECPAKVQIANHYTIGDYHWILIINASFILRKCTKKWSSNRRIILAKEKLATIHYDSAPRPQRSSFTHLTVCNLSLDSYSLYIWQSELPIISIFGYVYIRKYPKIRIFGRKHDRKVKLSVIRKLNNLPVTGEKAWPSPDSIKAW